MITIPAVKESCAGIDVGKRGIAVAVMTGPAGQRSDDSDSLVGNQGSGTEGVARVATPGGRYVGGHGERRFLLDSD